MRSDGRCGSTGFWVCPELETRPQPLNPQFGTVAICTFELSRATVGLTTGCAEAFELTILLASGWISETLTSKPSILHPKP